MEVGECVRELAMALQPVLAQCGSEKLEEILACSDDQVEGVDALVEWLRAQVSSGLGQELEDEIDGALAAGQLEPGQQPGVVAAVTERLLQSTSFGNLLVKVRGDIAAARLHEVEEMLDTASLSCSVTQTAMLFADSSQLAELATTARSRAYDERIAALRRLSQVQLSDAQNSESWPLIRRAMMDALSDPDEAAWSCSLRFCARGLAQHTPGSRHAYVLVAEHLQQSFLSRRPVRLSAGVELSQLARLIRVAHLLHQYQVQVTNVWVRFASDHFAEGMVDGVIALLNVTTGADTLAPIHLFALLDPAAEWLQSWLHSVFCRPLLFAAFDRHRRFLNTLVSSVVSLAMDGLPSAPDDMKDGRYSDAQLQLVLTIYAMNALKYILPYSAAEKLFPVRCRGEAVSLSQLMLMLARIVALPCGALDKLSLQLFNPSFVAAEALKAGQLWASADLLTPLLPHANSTPHSLLLIADVLSVYASSPRWRECFLAKTKDESPFAIILKYVNKELEWEGERSYRAVGGMLYVCRQLYTSHWTAAQLTLDSPLMKNIQHCLSAEIVEEDDPTLSAWFETLENNFLSLALTPRGGVVMCESERLTASVELAVRQILADDMPPTDISCAQLQHTFVLAQLAAHPVGAAAVTSTSLLSTLLRRHLDQLDTDLELAPQLGLLRPLLHSPYVAAALLNSSILEECLERNIELGLLLLEYATCHLSVAIQFNTASLLAAQEAARLPEGAILLDAETTDTNRLLVRLSCIGGEGERVLPPHSRVLFQPERWPLWSKFPVPAVYTPEQQRQRYNELSDSLASASPLPRPPPHNTPRCATGERLLLEYASRLGLPTCSADQMEAALVTAASITQSDQFDLLAGVMAIAAPQQAPDLIFRLANTSVRLLVWPQCGGVQRLLFTAHQLERLLPLVLPRVAAALQLASVSISLVVLHWTEQLFLNILPWKEVFSYLVRMIKGGPAAQVYFFLALFTHIEPSVLENVQNGRLCEDLLMNPISGFSASQYSGFFSSLQKTYGVELALFWEDVVKK